MTRLLAVAALAATAATPFRFSRPVLDARTWTRVEIPDDVFDACRAGIPDLRVTDADGREVPYAWEPASAPPAAGQPLRNFESTPRRETTAEADRGERPGLASAVSFGIPGRDFLKPVVVEASADRSTWKAVARGSVFAAGEVRMTTVRFPAASDRRYWRFRFDDRNGDPVSPDSVTFEPWGGRAPAERTLVLPTRLMASGAASVSAFSATLPAGNLPVSSLRISASDPAYSRTVRVFEKVFFRGEVSRRLLGQGMLLRTPGRREEDRIAVGGASSRNLEIEIENWDAPPLSIARIEANLPRRSIVFHAPEGKSFRLLYGSPSAAAPSYDLGDALARGAPAGVHAGALGPATESPMAPPTIAAASRGGVLDPGEWKTRRPILLPSDGGVAYLDLDEAAGEAGNVRIVDPENRQVPYILENAPVPGRKEAAIRISNDRARTIAVVGPIDPRLAVDALELAAQGAEYFTREVTVFEELRDARGPAGTRMLGTARWEKQPEEKVRPIVVPIARPEQRTLRVEIDNGDNAPLALSSAAVLFVRRRIDFLFRPGDSLFLLSDNSEAGQPKYDLQLLAGKILLLPAEPARLGPAEERKPEAALPGWFWAAVTISGVLVALALSRTLKKTGGA
jgi:hypothetical protein